MVTTLLQDRTKTREITDAHCVNKTPDSVLVYKYDSESKKQFKEWEKRRTDMKTFLTLLNKQELVEWYAIRFQM